MNLFVNAALLGFIPKGVKKGMMALAPVRRVKAAVLKDLGLPEDMLTFINFPTRYDCRETLAALKGSGISCPKLDDYAWRLWDYWERHLDPDLFIDRSLKGATGGKVVLVTGGSSGIGLAAAIKFAEAGAITLICARDEARLHEAVAEIKDKAERARVTDALLSAVKGPDSMAAIAQAATDAAKANAAQTSQTTYDKICADSLEAYAALNPHTKKEG